MITFAFPWMLAGLAAAAIPILLHLFARRDPPTVVFPAVRYLDQTARRHQRRFSLQHWLLLILRTLLIILLVLVAAGPSRPAGGGPGTHAPSALVLIADNSLSSAAVSGGDAAWVGIREAARRVLARATPADAVTLISAGEAPRRGTADLLRDRLDSLTPSTHRLDLAEAVAAAEALLQAGSVPGEIVVLTDLQRSAVGPADLTHPVLVGRPALPPPANAALAGFELSPQPWNAEGGLVAIQVDADTARRIPVTLRLGDGPPHPLLRSGSMTSAIRMTARPGWSVLRAELAPDELRLDDAREESVRIVPAPRVSWPAGDPFVAAAAQVLAENGRIMADDGRPGTITLDRLGPGPSVVLPPEDPARIGALNRALAERGLTWRFGEMVVEAVALDSGGPAPTGVMVQRRHRLVSDAAIPRGVLATAAGEPWLVREDNVALLGSRFDPAWSGLPVHAGFLPFLNGLLTRVMAGDLARLESHPGEAVSIPDRTTGVTRPDGTVQPVEGGSRFRVSDPGIHYLLERADTIGVIQVSINPRESRLDRISDGDLRALWSAARVTSLGDAPGLAFTAAARSDLRGPLIWTLVALALAEMLLASGIRRRR